MAAAVRPIRSASKLGWGRADEPVPTASANRSKFAPLRRSIHALSIRDAPHAPTGDGLAGQAVHSRAVAPPLHLEIESDGQRIALPPGRASVIGRTAGADVLIPNDTVSRRHARFSDEAGVWTVEDAGSASGTWVNDAATGARRVQLGVGDRIRLGQVVLIVRGGA